MPPRNILHCMQTSLNSEMGGSTDTPQTPSWSEYDWDWNFVQIKHRQILRQIIWPSEERHQVKSQANLGTQDAKYCSHYRIQDTGTQTSVNRNVLQLRSFQLGKQHSGQHDGWWRGGGFSSWPSTNDRTHQNWSTLLVHKVWMYSCWFYSTSTNDRTEQNGEPQ